MARRTFINLFDAIHIAAQGNKIGALIRTLPLCFAIAAALLLILLTASGARADCPTNTMGPQPTGRVFYNADYNTLQVCREDGQWYGMHGTASGCGGTCVAPALCPNVGDVCDDSNPATTSDPIFAGFIIDPATGGECRAVFLTRSAQGSGLQWSTAEGIDHILNDSMWDGRVNDSQIPDTEDFPAARLCKDLDYGGFTDWYLPAKEELNIISYNRDAIAPSLTDGWGWNTVSSSEQDDYNIWGQFINTTGESRLFEKTWNVFEVRCVRTESASGS